ncbi:hypothetical protein BGX34_000517 [Mortierella sp. NVP85]|nr:hypothetical protein BGX34_000517 [Mortierella sp. NVP85]
MQRHNHQIAPTASPLNAEQQPELQDTNYITDPDPSLQAASAVPLRARIVKLDSSDTRCSLSEPTVDGTPVSLCNTDHKNMASEPPHEGLAQNMNANLSLGTASNNSQTSLNHPSNHSTSSPTHSRTGSVTETVLAGAATAASTAVSAVETVVAAARRFAAQHDGDKDEGKDLADSEERDHQGLEFHQRHLSSRRDHASSSTSAVNSSRVSPSGADGSTEVGTTMTTDKPRTPPPQAMLLNDLHPNVPDHAALSLTGVKASDRFDTNAASHKASMGQNKDAQDMNAISTKDIHADPNDEKNPGLNRQVAPHGVMYVAGHGKDSTRHQAMGVDPPAVSKGVDPGIKHSGLGVDAPRLVGQPHDPTIHRTGSLHVDKKDELAHGHHFHVPHIHHHPTTKGDEHGAPIQTSKDNSRVIHGNVHHQTGNTLPEAKAAISKNPFEAHMSHHRESFSSGLNVDHPVIPTSTLAGSGSSDNTNHNRPAGTYNSGINVDKAGWSDHKRSGMGVDQPATTHHIAHAHGPFHLFNKHKTPTATASDDTSPGHGSGSKHPEGDHESFADKIKNVFHRRSATKVHDTPVANSAPIPPVATATGVQSADPSIPATMIPSEYEGPLPEVAPGDQVAWVKRTTQTDYYDNENDENEDIVASEDIHHREPNQSRHRNNHGHRSLLDRLRGRHPPADKGKQRV